MPHQDRATIDRRLAELEAQLPTLIAETSPESLIDAFAGIADEIRESAAPADLAHVDARIHCMLHEAGLVPGDEDEPCDDA
ncbi:hypothetical protein [uncultured Luteimonas sp.]|uniref:hypothetical protein n=1 Tax=uncultured Luteimonas sp. TaxID=453144 RepID=UPI002615088E|nr:hypothetical protein [uncultured Luteimonas sp.]